jgi:hypothetical protein
MTTAMFNPINTYRRQQDTYLIMAIVFLLVLGTNTAALSSQQSGQPPIITNSFNPHLGTYYYEIHWGALPVATAKIIVQKDGPHYSLTSDQQTIGLIDRIYRFHYRGKTVVRTEDLSPMAIVIQEQKGRQKRTLKAQYRKDQSIEVVETVLEKKKPPETDTYDISSETHAIDMYSAILLVRSLDWREGRVQQFEVFTGKKRYAVSMKCIGKGILKLNKKQIPAWIIRPHVLKLGDPNAKPRHTNARIYLSADESRDLLKIKTDIGIGGALVWELVYYQAQSNPVKRW